MACGRNWSSGTPRQIAAFEQGTQTWINGPQQDAQRTSRHLQTNATRFADRSRHLRHISQNVVTGGQMSLTTTQQYFIFGTAQTGRLLNGMFLLPWAFFIMLWASTTLNLRAQALGLVKASANPIRLPIASRGQTFTASIAAQSLSQIDDSWLPFKAKSCG